MTVCRSYRSDRVTETGVQKEKKMRLITIMKTFTIVAALVAGTSLAMAETGYGGPNGSQQLVTAPYCGPGYAP